MKKKIVAILMAMIMVISVTVVLAGSAADNDTKTKEPVIIGFKSTPSQADKAMVRGHGDDIKYSYTIINAVAAKLSESAIENIQRNPRVAYVEMDGEVHTLDTELDTSGGVKHIGAGIVHAGGNKGAGVNVAIIDTGIDYTHSDLDDNFDTELLGYDFANNDLEPMDDNGHGTHCAGIVAAEDNGVGVVGVAPGADLYAVKVLDSVGNGYMSDVVAGIQWSVDNGMDVISMSFGSNLGSTSLETACDNAYSSGVLVVAAAGNDGNPSGEGDNVDYPARYDSVIAVAATDSNDNRALWSSTGPDVELAAPGVSIYSTYLGGGYATMSGTSMACPHVSGTAALVISDVRQRLQNTADDLGAPGKDNLYGHGLVDAAEAAHSTGNQAPVADAGEDQTVSDADGNGVEAVTLDGSGSSDPDGSIDTYEWKEGVDVLSNAESFTDNFALGTHTVTLTVTDDGEASSSDDVIVTVSEAPSGVVEFEDSFEKSEWNGLWIEDSQNDWVRSTQRATDGSHSAEVDGWATDATLTMADPIDLSGKSTATLTFSWYIEENWNSGEYIALDVYDGTWQEVKRLSGNVGTENVWHHETIDLSSYIVSNFQIRFRAKLSSFWDDGNVDNVKIVSVGGEPNNPPDAPTNPVPADEATGICISPTLNVDISDPDGDAMDVIFYDASDDSVIDTDTNVPSGSKATVTWSGLAYETTYSWYAKADDGKDITGSATWSFRTEEEPSEIVEFFDSFEVSEWNGLWIEDSQNDWFRSTQRATDGSHSAEVDGWATDATLTMADPIDLSGKSTATLTFSWYIEENWNSGEYIALDVYDGTWQEVKRLSGNVGTENVWHHETIDLSSYIVSNFQIRFRAKLSSFWDDGNVDNVKIVSVGGEPNNPPDAPTNPVPADEATGICISPTLNVDISDPDGDAMDVIFYDASDDSVIDTDTNVPSGSKATVTWSGLAYETTYNWYAKADDGKDITQSAIWSFTTETVAPNNPLDTPTNPVPADEATGICISPTLNVDISDPDGDAMDVIFYDASDDSVIDTDTNVPSGSKATVTWSGLAYETTYNWYAKADDGKDITQSAIWSFTTETVAPNNPLDTPTNPVPADEATGICISPTLNVDISDPDGDAMDVIFYDASDDSVIDTDTNVPSGSKATVTWSGLAYETTYNWYAKADDGKDITGSATWSFRTEEEPSEIVEFFDSFEVSEWNGLWIEDSQNDWFRSTQRATDGSHSAEVDGWATDATLTMADPIDLSGKSTATLTFSWYIEENWNSGEYIALDVYDGTWQEVKRLSGNVGTENVWHHETIDLSSYIVSNFQIRFRAKLSSFWDDGNVDNVTIITSAK